MKSKFVKNLMAAVGTLLITASLLGSTLDVKAQDVYYGFVLDGYSSNGTPLYYEIDLSEGYSIEKMTGYTFEMEDSYIELSGITSDMSEYQKACAIGKTLMNVFEYNDPNVTGYGERMVCSDYMRIFSRTLSRAGIYNGMSKGHITSAYCDGVWYYTNLSGVDVAGDQSYFMKTWNEFCNSSLYAY